MSRWRVITSHVGSLPRWVQGWDSAQDLTSRSGDERVTVSEIPQSTYQVGVTRKRLAKQIHDLSDC